MTQRGTKRSKEDLRAQMGRVRSAIPPEERRERSERVASLILALPSVRRAGSVLLFSSFGTEVETDDLLRRLHDRGTILLLPYVEGDRMEAARFLPGDPMVTTDYGPREPAARDPVDPRQIDVVIAPGLAFDRRGHRLGYGAGFYDRFLSRLEPGAVRVGIGFTEQLVDRIPKVAHDQRVDIIVTDAEVIVAGNRTGRGPHPL